MFSWDDPDEIVFCLRPVEHPLHGIIGYVRLEAETDFLFARILSLFLFIKGVLQRIGYEEIWLSVSLQFHGDLFFLFFLKNIDDASENLPSSGSSAHSFHIFTVFIPGPDPYHIAVGETDCPIVPEIPRCPGLHENIPIRKIQCGVEGKSSEFRIAIREDGNDHIGIFRMHSFYALYIRNIRHRTERAVFSSIRENGIGLQEFEKGNLSVSERKPESVMIRIFPERSDSESSEEIQKNGYAYFFDELYGWYVHAFGERLPESDLSFVILGIILRFIGVIITGPVGDRKIEYSAFWQESESFKRERVCERFDGGSRLPEGEGRIDLSCGGFGIVDSADHDPQLRGCIFPGPFSYEDPIITHIPPSKLRESVFRYGIDPFGEGSIEGGPDDVLCCPVFQGCLEEIRYIGKRVSMLRAPIQLFSQHILGFRRCYGVSLRKSIYGFLESGPEIFRLFVGIIGFRIFREDQKSDLFRLSEIFRFPAEIIFRRRSEATVEIPEIHTIDVFREYPIFRIEMIQSYGIEEFQDFLPEGPILSDPEDIPDESG